MASKQGAYKDKAPAVLLSFRGHWISWTHTITAYCAFLGALAVGSYLHYHKIVQNEWYGYPDEWFPSVSATIGDRYPERSLFMLFIAITSGPRFALVGLWYLLTTQPGRSLPKLVAVAGLIRTLTCGGWTYVTSTDNHHWHDVFMISYLVFTIPWTAGCLMLSPPNPRAIRYRKYLAVSFFATLVPLVYLFIQHKVHRRPGAYTLYAFFEWSLVLLDVAFDAVSALDFGAFEITVRDVQGSSKGPHPSFVAPTAKLESKKARSTANPSLARYTLSGMLDVAADVYHGFVFWSTLTGLGVTVWYFPLWYMGLSGFEVFVMAPIAPFLLAIKPLRAWLVRHQRRLHLVSLAGLLAYSVRTPVLRLTVEGFGVFTTCLAWATTLSAEARQAARLESRVTALLAGLVLSVVVKFAWYTNNPLWPIMHADNGGANGVGFVVAVLAALRYSSRSRRVPLASGGPKPALGRKGSSFLLACGLGGLFFGLHSLLSDSSTMILWVWNGYPVRGPVAQVHAWFTLAAMTAGLVLGLYRPRLASLGIIYALACVGTYLVTTRRHWLGYGGGLMLAVYLMALASPLLARAAKTKAAVTFGGGFMVYNIMVLFHVWVVAYAFVPGGPLVREHTDWVMLSLMLLLGAGVVGLKVEPPPPPTISSAEARRRGSDPPGHGHGHSRRHHLALLGLVHVAFFSANVARFPSNDYTPYHGADRIMTAGIWTIHFGLDNDMWSSEYRMRDLLRELELDVIGLLESDCQRIIMGNRDVTQFLAQDLGMYVDYGPGPNQHTWGVALLSKFPILNSTHHLLPSPAGELAPAIHATLDVYGEAVDVFVFHSGQEEDVEDRRLQSEYLAALMGGSPRPSVLLSYLVTKPNEGNYHTYVSERSGMHDVDPSDWDRWCEYILYKGLWRTGYARVSRGTVTDTELQVAKFVVHEGREARAAVWAADAEARNKRVSEAEVPEGWRFPALFRGEGVRGHRYHVFDEPQYFN